jgi:hypothetical protein
MTKIESLKDLLERCSVNGECLEYCGSIIPSGYGQVRFRGKIWMAHRLSYMLANGEVPTGLNVCHACDNKKCLNPKHLFSGTQKENIQDAFKKGLIIRPKGEEHPRATLTVSDVLKIRSLYIPWRFSYRRIASLLGVSPDIVQSIIFRKSWKHI